MQTGSNVLSIQTDFGGEFVNQQMTELMKDNGIEHLIVPARTPQMNGEAEKIHSTIFGLARAMLKHANLPNRLWAECTSYAINVLNVVSINKHTGLSPFEMIYKRRPQLNNIQEFGSPAYVLDTRPTRKKLQPKSKLMTLVGIDSLIDSYRLWDRETNKVVRSKNVFFPKATKMQGNNDIPSKTAEELQQPGSDVGEEADLQAQDETTADEESSVDREEEAQEAPEAPAHRLRPKHTLRPPKRYEETNMTEILEPSNISEALNSSHAKEWEAAIKLEMEQMEANKVWTKVQLPPGKKTVKSKFIFKIKRLPGGKIDKFKVRLCAAGYSQRFGVNYDETYAPVSTHSSLRIMLALAAANRWHTAHLDVTAAFLSTPLKEEVYMEPPFPEEGGQKYKLVKSIYGLKQSAREFSILLASVITKIGFCRSNFEPCLFFRRTAQEYVAVLAYVDDLAVFASRKELIEELKKHLSQHLKITSRPLEFFLGIEISRNEQGDIKLSQGKYIDELLQRFEMVTAKSACTPLASNSNESSGDAGDFPYRCVVGSLQYLNVATRIDISFSVNLLSRRLENPSKSHCTHAKHVLRYLKGTRDTGIQYSASVQGDPASSIQVFSDSDLAGCEVTRRSTTGFVIKLCGAPVGWCSKLQRTVSLSTCESELISAVAASQQALWCKRLLKEVTGAEVVPKILIDNLSTIHVIRNPAQTRQCRHIEIKEYFLRDRCAEGDLQVEHVCTEFNEADILTKNLGKQRFIYLRSLLGLK